MNDKKAQTPQGHVLIVDDNPTNLNILVDYLSLTGFEVFAAEDGQSALDLLTRVQPDIILLDVMMPDLDGFETCRRIKAQPEFKDIPVIFMTALSDTRDKIRGFEAGAVDYITKPAQHREVLARLNTHLSMRYMHARLEEQNARLAREIAEREQAEAALRASEERYRILVENQGEGIAVSDLEEQFTFANPAAEHIFGVAPGELTGRNLCEFLSAEQIEKVRQQTAQRLTGLKSAYELEIIRADGKECQILVTGSPWFDEQGKVVGTFGSFRDITARKQVEEQLRKLSQAVEQSPSTVVITDIDGKIEYANPKYSQLTGYTSEETVGKLIYIPQSTEPAAAATEGLWNTITAGQVWRGEFYNRKKNGDTFWELASISPIKNTDGTITHFVKVAEDITERKHAEDTLRRYTHTLAQLNYLGQRLTATLNPQEIAVQLSHTATEIIGTESVSVWLLENVPADSQRPPELVCWTSYHHFQADQKHSPVNMRLPVGQGVVGWVAQTGESLIVSDTLKDSRFFPGVSEKTGFQVHALLAVPLRVRDTVIGVLEMVNKRNGEFVQNDLTLVETLAASVAIAIDNAHLVEALRHYTVELETHNAELDAFAHTVAHDLKNPLSALLTSTQMLETYYPEMQAEKIQNSLSLLTQTGYKMTNIIDELLLLSSVRKMGEIDIETLDLSAIAKEACARIQDLLTRHNAELTIPDEWPEALGYAPWIEEVWANYISNAIKYGGSPAERIPPHVELGFSLPQGFKTMTGISIKKDYICFWVRDDGTGLTPEQQGRLFAPFERLSQKRIEGHGLGLSIVRRIVERFGGEVGVQSAVGQGSLFYFTLPGPMCATEIDKFEPIRPMAGIAMPDLVRPQRAHVAAPQGSTPRAASPRPEVTPGMEAVPDVSTTRTSKGFVLVVDDTLTNQLLLSQMLEMEGYDVATASTGMAALESVKSAPPDLILLDVNMPTMNGYEVCEHLKADPTTREIPVLFISALSQTKDKVKAFTAGGVDYVVKPFQPEEVLARVETHLTLRDLQRQLMRYAQHLQHMVTEKVRELERERSKIVQMDKMAALGQMATGVAHELNQPLTAISFEADYLQTVAHKARTEQIAYDTLLDVDQLEEMGENLRGDVARCRRIIDHLRTFGRTSTDESTPIDLNRPIEDCFILIGARLKNHNINVHLDLDPELPPILADTHRLEQVFLNLIGNAEHAVEAMAERVEAGILAVPGFQKTLSISTYVAESNVIAEVRDNGCGMPEDAQKHIFEPFFTTKPVGEGTGLGLSISYGIVTELGGEIAFASAEDAGTTFTLRFPIAESPSTI